MPGAVIGNPIPDWLKPENASVLDSPVTKAIRTLAHLIGADDPQSQVLGLMTPLVPDGQAMASKPVQKALKTLADLGEKVGIRAYHGSPHDFDRFSLSKIGTGEGAQAYGHGLYFAENPEVAAEYARMHLTGPENVAHKLKDFDPDYVRKRLKSVFPQMSDEEISRAVASASEKGKTYEVSINADPEQLLDWDKPLSQQPEAVRYLFADDAPETSGRDIYNRLMNDQRDVAIRQGRNSDTTLPKAQGSASQWLRDAGIPGIKYLDGGSRAAGEGSRNFVIFDDSLIDILKKYGVALPVIEGLRRKANAQGGKLRAEDVQAVF